MGAVRDSGSSGESAGRSHPTSAVLRLTREEAGAPAVTNPVFMTEREVADVLVAHLCAKTGLGRDQIQGIFFDVQPAPSTGAAKSNRTVLRGVRVVLSDGAAPRRRPNRALVADFYNREILPKKRQDFASEYGREPDPERLFEVHPENLTLGHEWECASSPTHFCVYEASRGEACLFCGEPEERR